MVRRAEVPPEVVRRCEEILGAFPRCVQEDAWTGVRWRVGSATVAHVFGGEDQLIRVTFRAEPDEAMALRHLGPPYFGVGASGNAVGVVVDEATDWAELAELLTDSYCLQAPQHLARQVARPSEP